MNIILWWRILLAMDAQNQINLIGDINCTFHLSPDGLTENKHHINSLAGTSSPLSSPRPETVPLNMFVIHSLAGGCLLIFPNSSHPIPSNSSPINESQITGNFRRTGLVGRARHSLANEKVGTIFHPLHSSSSEGLIKWSIKFILLEQSDAQLNISVSLFGVKRKSTFLRFYICDLSSPMDISIAADELPKPSTHLNTICKYVCDFSISHSRDARQQRACNPPRHHMHLLLFFFAWARREEKTMQDSGSEPESARIL